MSLSNRWGGLPRVGTAAQLAGITLAPGQVAQASDTGLIKRGPGLFSALAYEPQLYLSRQTDVVCPFNDATERDCFAATTLPAGLLASDGNFLHVYQEVYCINSINCRIRIYLDEDAIFDGVVLTGASSDFARVFFARTVIRRESSTAARVGIVFATSNNTASAPSQVGNLSSSGQTFASSSSGDQACNWSADQAFRVTITNNASTSSVSNTQRVGLVHLNMGM